MDELKRNGARLLSGAPRRAARRPTLRSLFDAYPVPSAFVALDGTVLMWNKEAERVFGWREDEVIGRTSRLIPPDKISEYWHLLADGAQHRITELQTTRLKRDGTLVEVSISISAVRGDNDEIAGLMVILQDVSEQQRVTREREKLLAEVQLERGLFEAVLRQMPSGVLIAEAPSGRIVLSNQQADNILGHAVIQSRNISEYGEYRLQPVDGTPFNPHDAPMARAISNGEVIVGEEWIYVRGDNEHRVLLTSAGPVRDEQGRIVAAAAVFDDVTEHKRSLERLQNQQKWLEALLDLIPTALLLLEPKTAVVRFANRAANEMAGGEFPKNLPGEQYHEVYYCTDASGRRISNQEMPGVRAAQGERLRGFEMNWHLPGRTRAVLLDSDYLPDSHGHPPTAIVSFSDVTRLKQVEEELRRANRVKDQFLAVLGHELRNPLAPMTNALHLLRFAPQRQDLRERSLNILDRQLKQMVRLIDDLLDMSRIASGKISLRLERLDLMEAMQSALESCNPLISTGGHQVEFTASACDLFVEADAARLTQVFCNLLNNAARYTPPGGHIRIAVERDGSYARVRIADDGIGIPRDKLGAIFELFSQVNPSSEPSGSGLGVGLNLAKRLVEMHGGSIAAHSDGAAQGAEFTVRLPLSLTGETQPVKSAPSATGTALRVLVVDDNRDSADTLHSMLHLDGHQVVSAYDGPQALTIAASFNPDLVLLDLGMPGMDGFEVARRLRLLPAGQRAFIVATTGWGQDEDRQRTRQAGFDAHLVKPVGASAIHDILAGLSARA